MSENYLVTAFDQALWKRWGVSWLASVKEFSKFDGNVMVLFDQDVDQCVLDRVSKYAGAHRCPRRHGVIGIDAKLTVAEAEPVNGLWVYYEPWVYFQDDINPLWSLIDEGMVVALADNVPTNTDPMMTGAGHVAKLVPGHLVKRFTGLLVENAARWGGRSFSAGMIGGTGEAWDLFGKFLAFCLDGGGLKPVARADELALNLFGLYFRHTVGVVDDVWNCRAKDGLAWHDGFYLGPNKVKAVNPDGEDAAYARQYQFAERRLGEYREWDSLLRRKNALSPRYLIKHGTGRHLKFEKGKTRPADNAGDGGQVSGPPRRERILAIDAPFPFAERGEAGVHDGGHEPGGDAPVV